ncbi:MAG: hypothetical protein CM1200mP22_06040 [Dehalococcoidia bacterium]|nr:MAG: hypothetical protein CM1200mP22_06040 [Dehalococcoidia bacterium]
MDASDVALLDSDSAAAMMDTMGASSAVAVMEQDSLAAMIGVMDGNSIVATLDSNAAISITQALTEDNLSSLGAEQAAGIVGVIDASSISELSLIR